LQAAASGLLGLAPLSHCLAEAAASFCCIDHAITLDLAGSRMRLPRALAQILRDAAAHRAGSSSSQRDLSLILTRAIETGSLVALQRPEIRALLELLESGQITTSTETAELLALARDAVSRG
jgi:hypothetical protein